jgi:hypothetical protein
MLWARVCGVVTLTLSHGASSSVAGHCWRSKDSGSGNAASSDEII